MDEITYWRRKYQEFIDTVLHSDQQALVEEGGLIGEQIPYLEINRGNLLSENPKRFVLFLLINHQLNILNPNESYPQVHNQYADHALEILDMYSKGNEGDFNTWLSGFLHGFWTQFSTLPSSSYGWQIQKVQAAIEKHLSELHKRQWGYINGKPLKSRAFWNHHFDRYLEKLWQDQQDCLAVATRFDYHIEWLRQEQDFVLTRYAPRDYIMYLYVNQELNRLDPMGWGYPGLNWDEYYDYAWEIVALFRVDSGSGFPQQLTDYLYQFCEIFACYRTPTLEESVTQSSKRIEGFLRALLPQS